MNSAPTFAVGVLCFNRPERARKLAEHLYSLRAHLREVILVDNASDVPLEPMMRDLAPLVRVIRTTHNEGTGARNHAFLSSDADILIALDDDVMGLDEASFAILAECFADPAVAAVNLKVVNAINGRPMNWCHPRPMKTFHAETFETPEMSEGAVAMRRAAAVAAGLFPQKFFISHEGPDLALRLINAGHRVIYDPRIVIRHDPAAEGRASWRRYYYDTRNVFWLAARNLPWWWGVRRIAREGGAMMIYSLRDRHFLHWMRGVIDGIAGIPEMLRERNALGPDARSRVRDMERLKPGVVHWLRHRLLRSNVEI
jgi:GT2 family glycosyltransferase